MWIKLLQYALSFILGRIMEYLKSEWDEYQEDEIKKKEVKIKIKAIKNAKSKEELRVAIRDLHI